MKEKEQSEGWWHKLWPFQLSGPSLGLASGFCHGLFDCHTTGMEVAAHEHEREPKHESHESSWWHKLWPFQLSEGLNESLRHSTWQVPQALSWSLKLIVSIRSTRRGCF